MALKSYCTKVYQHYSKIMHVSEDQVTKYLQQRITETFKLKPDLNIAWHEEPVPNIEAIRKVAPLSQQQIMQQKKQEAAIAIAKANASKILANKLQMKQQQATTQGANLKQTTGDPKTPLKRKNRSQSRSTRSSSSSSTSSSDSSSNVKLSANKKKTGSPKSGFISLVDSTSKKTPKLNKKNLNNSNKKKTLKNIQINSINGKKSFSFMSGIEETLKNSANKKLANKLKKNLSIFNENNSEESDAQEEDDDDDDTNELHGKKQLKAKLVNRQQRFMKTNADRKFIVEKKNIRSIFRV